MANPYEQREDPFKERPVASPMITGGSPASVVTPLAPTLPQSNNNNNNNNNNNTGAGYNSHQPFYGGPSTSSPGSPQQTLPPPPPTSPALQNPQQPQSKSPQFQQQPQFQPQPYQQQFQQQPPLQPTQQQQQQQQAEQVVTTSKFWTLEFYQQFFDVDTRLVLLRMSNTLVPINPPDFLMDRDWRNNSTQTPSYELEEAGVTLSRKPDLYGPFWICTTLWMILGIVSNIMSRIAFGHQTNTDGQKWSYDFTMASVACIVIYMYCFGLSCIMWGVMQYKSLPVSLLDTLCLYGYSMFIFLPVTILCTIPVGALQWIIVIVGGVWSTAFLLINFWHVWKVTLNRAWFLGIVSFVGVFHMLLTMSFKFYFLNYKF